MIKLEDESSYFKQKYAEDSFPQSLQESSFKACTFEKVAFNECDLTKADFRGTKLKGVDFRSSDITGIRIKVEELPGVIVTSMQALAFAEMLEIVISDESTE